jgi:hypothetical protein
MESKEAELKEITSLILESGGNLNPANFLVSTNFQYFNQTLLDCEEDI